MVDPLLNKTLPQLNEVQAGQSVSDYYKYSDKERDVVQTIFWRFRDTQQERDKSFEYLDKRGLIEYINDSVLRFVTNIDQRDDIEDWQARVHAPFTRNKILTLLGKVISELPITEVVARGDQDLIKAEIVNTLFEYAENADDSEEFFIYALEEALVKGTMIGYEGIETITKATREVVKYKNGDDIEVKDGTITTRRLVSQIVPLEQFYPSSVGIRKITDMPYCFWRKEVPYTKFAQDYRNFSKAQYVSPWSSNKLNQSAPQPFYFDYVTPTTREGTVEVINYYNQDTDEYVILANGIWLNPLQNEIISPLPFAHKKLPFFSFIYEMFGSDFFYGKSMADKLKSLQDVLNVLQNMMLDQSFLSIFPPILMAGTDDIEDDFLRPGRRIPVDTGGLPINQAFQKLDLSTGTGWHAFILNYTKSILEESSLDRLQQGQAGVGGRTTATEINAAAHGVESMLSLFMNFIRNGVKQRARLRISNILQFYTDPQYPIVESVLGEGGQDALNKAFNIFTIDSMPMTPGKRGTKIIEVYKDQKSMPTKKEIVVKTRIDELMSGKRVSRTSVTPEYIRHFEFDVILRDNPNNKTGKEIDRALEIQFQQTMLTLYPDLVDRPQMAAELTVKFGRDPSKVLKDTSKDSQKAQQDPMNGQMQQPGAQGQQGQQPQQAGLGGSNASNIVSSGTGVNPSLLSPQLNK